MPTKLKEVEVNITKSDEIDKKVCEENIPTKFNIYLWGKKHPDASISHSLSRIEKIFDKNDEIMFGFSAGKDSTLSANFAILELKRRWARVEAKVKRDGSDGVDPLDSKWVGKKLWFNSMNCEWIWSDAIKHTNNFIKEHGPKGDNVLNIFYKCLRLGWQSGVSFGDSRLTSWDLNHKDMWIMPMPDNEELGIEVVTNENISICNAVPLSSLSEEMQSLRRMDGSVFEKDGIEMVANYGLGNHTLNLKGYESINWNVWTFENQDEDMEQETFSRWFMECFPVAAQIGNLVSLRASESFDRYTILKQCNYATGEYAKSTLNSVDKD